jgi:hypothetical protein
MKSASDLAGVECRNQFWTVYVLAESLCSRQTPKKSTLSAREGGDMFGRIQRSGSWKVVTGVAEEEERKAPQGQEMLHEGAMPCQLENISAYRESRTFRKHIAAIAVVSLVVKPSPFPKVEECRDF